MAFSAKSFHSRNHIEGQLIGAAELIEMQDLANTTLCNIEADRYGLNDDATFTPHVIAGLKPSKVTGEQKIRISRGLGWVVDSPSGAFFNFDRIPVFLEEELEVDIPSGDATHPKWVQVMLRNPLSGKNVKYGNANVSVQDVNRVITTVTAPLYNRRYTAEAVVQEGTAAASPDCPIVTNVSYLPIATVYIPAGFSGEVDPANIYDVRWFAPGFGTSLCRIYWDDGTSIIQAYTASDFQSIHYNRAFTTGGSGGAPELGFYVPNQTVFPLIPQVDLAPITMRLHTGTATFAYGSELTGTVKTPVKRSSLLGTVGAGAPWKIDIQIGILGFSRNAVITF